MKAKLFIYIYLALYAIFMIFSACSDNDNENTPVSQSSIIGTWKVVAGDIHDNGEKYIYVVTFGEDNSLSFDYYIDTDGYGIYVYENTVNSDYSFNPETGFCNIGSIASAYFFNFTLISSSSNNFIVDSWAGNGLRFERYTESTTESSLYGYWKYEQVSGETIKADGSVAGITGFFGWNYLYFSENEIKGLSGYNGIVFKNREEPKFMRFQNSDNQLIFNFQGNTSADNIFNTYTINKVNENELILQYSGPDKSEEGAYLNVIPEHTRIKTIKE